MLLLRPLATWFLTVPSLSSNGSSCREGSVLPANHSDLYAILEVVRQSLWTQVTRCQLLVLLEMYLDFQEDMVVGLVFGAQGNRAKSY